MTATASHRVERHRGREAALQLLYQWEIGQSAEATVDDAIELYWTAPPAPASRRASHGAHALAVRTKPALAAHAAHFGPP